MELSSKTITRAFAELRLDDLETSIDHMNPEEVKEFAKWSAAQYRTKTIQNNKVLEELKKEREKKSVQVQTMDEPRHRKPVPSSLDSKTVISFPKDEPVNSNQSTAAFEEVTKVFFYSFRPNGSALVSQLNHNIYLNNSLPTTPRLTVPNFKSVMEFLIEYDEYRRRMTDLGHASKITSCIDSSIVEFIRYRTGFRPDDIWRLDKLDIDTHISNKSFMIMLLKALKPNSTSEVILWFNQLVSCRDSKHHDQYNTISNITNFINNVKKFMCIWLWCSAINNHEIKINDKALAKLILSKIEPPALRKDSQREYQLTEKDDNLSEVSYCLNFLNFYLIRKIDLFELAKLNTNDSLQTHPNPSNNSNSNKVINTIKKSTSTY